MNRLIAAVAVITIANAASLATQSVVQIHLRGRYYSDPATVRVTIAVEPDSHNRTLVVLADGDRLFRSSELPLHGDKEQRIHTVEFKNLPTGHYVFRAEVHSADDVRGIAEQEVIVGDAGDRR